MACTLVVRCTLARVHDTMSICLWMIFQALLAREYVNRDQLGKIFAAREDMKRAVDELSCVFSSGTLGSKVKANIGMHQAIYLVGLLQPLRVQGVSAKPARSCSPELQGSNVLQAYLTASTCLHSIGST